MSGDGGARAPGAPPGTDETARFTIQGEAVIFGFPPRPVQLRVLRRPRSWRLTGAAQRLAVFVAVAPFTALVPPHAPWLIGSLTAGVVLARRRWSERFTLERVEGACPKCGEPLAVKAGRLKVPHPVSCDACHHQTALQFPESALQSGSAAAG